MRFALSLVGVFLIPLVLTTLGWLIIMPFAWWWVVGSADIFSQWVWYTVVRGHFFPGMEFGLDNLTGLFWFFFALWGAVWLGLNSFLDSTKPKSSSDSNSSSGSTSTTTKLVAVPAVLMIVAGLIAMVWVPWQNDKQLGAYWNKDQRVVFMIEDKDKVPTALQTLTNNEGTKRMDEGDCVYKRSGDVEACIKVGRLPMKWNQRKSSLDAAMGKLKKASLGGSNTYVLDGSATYLYTDGGKWTAVRDGHDRADLDAVVEWNGEGDATDCKFEGKFEIKGSFDGAWSHNLPDILAEQFPNLYYDVNDVWGFCNDKEPVVVLPVTRQIAYYDQSVMTNAGVIVIRGDNGKARIYQVKNPSTGSDLEKGQFPGPTYPISLTKSAREASSWAAGRVNHSGGKFGFEPTDSAVQHGNVSEYLLQNAITGELEWVTPLTPRGSDSQQFIAWSITPAGSGYDGQLNQTKIYVLPDNDPRVVNLPDLEASTKSAINSLNPGFLSTGTGGEITEFLPVDEGMWQAYGELGNRVVYRIDVPANTKIKATITTLDATVIPGQPDQPVTPPVVPGTNGVCSQPLGTLTPEQLRVCASQALDQAQQFIDELAKRPTTSPSASPSAAPSTPVPTPSRSGT
jgi:hypothetical protein